MPELTHTTLYDCITETADHIGGRFDGKPQVGIVLGTGLGGLVGEIEIRHEIPYSELPHFPVSTVESHEGRLIFGRLSGQEVVAMQGRFHGYEGYSPLQITFPVRVMARLGIHTLLVSNACGGVNPIYERGDLMIIHDHINFQALNPLIGFNDERLGPRFPDMSRPYDPALVATLEKLALEMGIPVRKGIYLALTGPNLETRAEYRMIRAFGADAVGMSTVPEVLVARHCGLRVGAMSVVTDMCLPDALEEARIEEIIAVASEAEPDLTRLLSALVGRLPALERAG